MTNFNIFGVHRKIRVLGGVHKKPIYRGDCLKTGGEGGGAWTVCRFKEGLGKKEWG